MANNQRPGDTTRKGYGYAHQQLRKRWTPYVQAGNTVCPRCDQVIEPGQLWDLGHRDGTGKREYSGPEHSSCNRAAGAAARTPAHDPDPRPMTDWSKP